MRLLVAVVLLIPTLGLSQTERDRKFMGFGIEAAFNLLDEPTLSYEEYKSVIGASEFFLHSDNAQLMSSSTLFSRNGIGLRFIFRGPDSENFGAFKRSRFNIGVQFNSGNNYSFNFHEVSQVRADTITMTYASGSSQILYRDTIFYHDTKYSAHSKNLGAFCEYLIYTGEGMPSIATGIGVASEVTMLYQAQVRQTLNYETGLYNEAGIPQFADIYHDPQTGADYGSSHFVYGNSVERKIPTAYFIRPYIPVRIETVLSNRPKLSHFTFDINAKIGTEIQINPGVSVNGRMFYSLGVGLSYYF